MVGLAGIEPAVSSIRTRQISTFPQPVVRLCTRVPSITGCRRHQRVSRWTSVWSGYGESNPIRLLPKQPCSTITPYPVAPCAIHYTTVTLSSHRQESNLDLGEWSTSGSNRPPSACHADALPTELVPQVVRSLVQGLSTRTCRSAGLPT